MDAAAWYNSLIQPSFAPPAWVFGPVWTVLYIIIGISFAYVVYLYLTKQITFSTTLPFSLNLIFNLIFSPIQFTLQNNFLAAIDILLVLGTIIWAMIVIWPQTRLVALVNIPYLAWISFATVLQLSVTWLNR